MYFVCSLFIPTFNSFSPSSLCKECLFYTGYITLDTWPSITSPALETSLKSGNLCFISHSTFGVVLILRPHQTQAETTTFTKRHACFHQIPSVLLQEQENCFDLQRGFPGFVAPFVGACLCPKSLEPLQKRPLSLPVYLFPLRRLLQHLATNLFLLLCVTFPKPCKILQHKSQSHSMFCFGWAVHSTNFSLRCFLSSPSPCKVHMRVVVQAPPELMPCAVLICCEAPTLKMCFRIVL